MSNQHDEIERAAVTWARKYHGLPRTYDADALAPEVAGYVAGASNATRRERERWLACFVPCPRAKPSARTRSTAHDPVTCPHGCYAGWLIDEYKFAAVIREGGVMSDSCEEHDEEDPKQCHCGLCFPGPIVCEQPAPADDKLGHIGPCDEIANGECAQCAQADDMEQEPNWETLEEWCAPDWYCKKCNVSAGRDGICPTTGCGETMKPGRLILRMYGRILALLRELERTVQTCHDDHKTDVKRMDKLKRERDGALNLLARIHGDGGHYVEKHGFTKACEDAEDIVINLRGDLDATLYQLDLADE